MPAGFPLLVAPIVATLLIVYVMRPRPGTTVAPLRLAAVRAALLTGTFAVLSVELLGAFGALTTTAMAVAWSVFLVGAVGLFWWRRRRQPRRTPGEPLRGPARWCRGAAGRLRGATGGFWRTTSVAERLLTVTLVSLVLVEFVIALIAEPNNFDSQTYHLPRVEHWAAQHSLSFWPTAIHRQITIPPGAEYLLLHLRLLTGGDTFHNLVQWLAGIGCLLLASRITAQLGGGRRAQLITAFLVATTPMVALQATSTQTDLTVAAWTGCVVTLALDDLSRRAGVGSVLALGAATGLTAVTKTSGLLGAGPFLVLWGLAQLRLVSTGVARAVTRTALATMGILAVTAVITGPFLARVQAEFGHPLGPPRLRESIPMQRHDPASILINGLRIAHTALDTPLTPLDDAAASAIKGLAGLLGVDPQDRATTFGRTTFPVRSWYPDEDRVAFPITGVLVLVGGVLAIARPGRIAAGHARDLRMYAVAAAGALLLHVAMLKWQPWGNRLLLYGLILATPLAGLWLDALFRRRVVPGRRSVAASLAVVTLATSALAAGLAVSYGFPRRLVGTGSLLTTSDWDTRFLRRPQWADEYRWAAAAVNASGAQRIGLVEGNDDWEYPWWLLFRDGGDPDADRREIVPLQSVLPHHPPADPSSVDAIVCTGTRAACAKLVPPGWRLDFRDHVGYALPPGG